MSDFIPSRAQLITWNRALAERELEGVSIVQGYHGAMNRAETAEAQLADCQRAHQDQVDLCGEYLAVIHQAVDILDGNAPSIDWRDPSQPELLRKLCEHLETTDDETSRKRL